LALRRESPWLTGELACWRQRAGVRDPAAEELAEPYALELAGENEAAADAWGELGCPYEAALALLGTHKEEPLRRALTDLGRLGAKPAAAIVARRLRARGARGLPRGPYSRARENAAGLTSRELDVVKLLAEGLRNAEIAERLVLSEKTVDHHVSSVLRKLNVRTRGQAASEAVRLEILTHGENSPARTES
jgi:DNA-binding CsgD family transcriptional regulator